MDNAGNRRPAPNRINYTTLTEQLEQALRIDILEGVLRPGQRIRANEMTRRYGVSATPLREALQRLAVEMLVELDPRLGATVAPISEEDLIDIYDMLELVDGLALERSIERGDDQWVAELDRAFDRLAETIAEQEAITDKTDDDTRREVAMKWSDAHWQFHHALYAACGSAWLMHFVSQLHKHSERYRMLTAQPLGGMRRNSLKEHKQIYQAAKRRDSAAAVKALREHLATTVKLLREGLVEQLVTSEEPNPARTRASLSTLM